MELRVGNGFDIHSFDVGVGAGPAAGDGADEGTPARMLVLGGVEFPGETPLVGHSDADVIAHAVGEALLGAAGLGDLGSHFPDTDERWRGADSITLLGAIVGMLAAEGWTVANVDCSVVAETPRMAPSREAMQRRLSACVGAPVTVKGRRAEGLGALGRGEGIACSASALIIRDV